MTLHSLEQHFMELASETLAPDMFAQLVVAAEKRLTPGQPRHIPVPRRHRVEKQFLQDRIGQAFADCGPVPLPPMDKQRMLQEGSHVAARLEERMQLAVSAADLGELGQLIRRQDRNVRTLRTQMQTILHCEVQWRGKSFVVIFNQSRDELITAYELKSSRPPTHKGVRFPGEKARRKFSVRDIDGDEE